MNDRTDVTIRIDLTLDTRTTQLVRCTAYAGPDCLIDTFDVVCSRPYDTAVVFPAAGPEHREMEKVENVETLIGCLSGMDDGKWARAVAVAAVRRHLRLPPQEHHGRAA